MNKSPDFPSGGTIKVDNPFYVERPSDNELYKSLKEQEFCSVLNSRQMGKSSLMIRVKNKLENNNIICPSIDCSEIGANNITPDMWYRGMLNRLNKTLSLRNFDAESWWTSQGTLPPSIKLKQFFSNKMLKEVENDIVIFIDEIDTTLKLDFRDDFFSLLRNCYNQRADDPDYRRMTFCLLGVASPSDLIRESKGTPYNIGRRISLTGFKITEVAPLIEGLEQAQVTNSKEAIEKILDMTGGQPLLTLSLCNMLKSSQNNDDLDKRIRTFVDKLILEDCHEHFRTIKKRITDYDKNTIKRLQYYQEIFKKGSIITRDDVEIKNDLILTGLVIEENNKLSIFNKIYKKRFNLEWINDELKATRPYHEKFIKWQNSSEKNEGLYLLNKEELNKANEWAKDKDLPKIDTDYIRKSDRYLDNIRLSLPRNLSSQSRSKIAESIRSLSKGYLIIEDILINISRAHDTELNPIEDKEEPYASDLVEKLKDLLKSKNREDFNSLMSQLDDNIKIRLQEIKTIYENKFNDSTKDECDLFWLHITYEHLLKENSIPLDNSHEQEKLIAFDLAQVVGNSLEIAIPLYSRIFDNRWLQKNKKTIRFPKIFNAYNAINIFILLIKLRIIAHRNSMQNDNSPEYQFLIEEQILREDNQVLKFINNSCELFFRENKLCFSLKDIDIDENLMEEILTCLDNHPINILSDDELRYILMRQLQNYQFNDQDVNKIVKASLDFIKKIKESKPLKESYPNVLRIITEMFKWSESEDSFTKIFEKLRNQYSSIESGTEKEVVNELTISTLVSEVWSEKNEQVKVIEIAKEYLSQRQGINKREFKEVLSRVFNSSNNELKLLKSILSKLNYPQDCRIEVIDQRIKDIILLTKNSQNGKVEESNQPLGNTMPNNVNELLNRIVTNNQDSLECILLVSLVDGQVLYYNSDLENGKIFFGDHGCAPAFTGFSELNLKKALDTFGKESNSGDIKCFLVMLENRLIMLYPFYIEGLPVSICYIGKNNDNTSFSLVYNKIFRTENTKIIEQIKTNWTNNC